MLPHSNPKLPNKDIELAVCLHDAMNNNSEIILLYKKLNLVAHAILQLVVPVSYYTLVQVIERHTALRIQFHTSESPVQDPDCYGHELPALEANLRLLAACSDVIVVRHVDVKYQFFLESLEAGLLDPVAHAWLEGREGGREGGGGRDREGGREGGREGWRRRDREGGRGGTEGGRDEGAKVVTNFVMQIMYLEIWRYTYTLYLHNISMRDFHIHICMYLTYIP